MEVKIISKDLRVNEEIRAREVRLVDTNGDQLGILALKDALKLAQERGVDLVEVASAAKPPVCRIMDFGKYSYEQSKREKEARKKQKVINVKEVKFRLGIDEHDFQVKARNAIKFLQSGDKVKVTIMFRGREISHTDLGKELCLKLANQLSDIAGVEKAPNVEGKNMTMILSPKQDK
ncbi:translation initiation factor IF-3 [Bacillota bacterium LX-D]|nr:translation initiation factor IF-3 [Bacillota bacterium LX-D]